MFPEDIERLFPMVSVGTPVYIVDQPMKVGHLAGGLFLEFHPPLEESQAEADASTTLAMQEISQKLAPQIVAIDPLAVRLVVEQASGLPVEVTAN
jgi:L,D-transpeptidase ErfK/SrfK